MGVEIERRFLIDGREEKPWRTSNFVDIFQCYLSGVRYHDGEIMWNGIALANDEIAPTNITTWRMRVVGNDVVLTAKGKRTGAMAEEFEWDIPIELFNSLPTSDLPSIKKRRYHWIGVDGLLWEVDEFEDILAGLIIAEVELDNVDQSVDFPPWLGMELTNLRGWSNASLSMMIKDSRLD